MAVHVQPPADPRWSLISREPYPLLIGGRFMLARDRAVFPAISPRDNPIASIAQAGSADVADAVTAARAAFDEGPWGRTPARDRAAALLRIADLISPDRRSAQEAGGGGGQPAPGWKNGFRSDWQ